MVTLENATENTVLHLLSLSSDWATTILQMQDMNHLTKMEMWRRRPESFSDLSITDTKEGWQPEAPDNSDMAEWLQYWNQTEEHHDFFEKEFIETLTNYIKNVEIKTVPNGGQNGPEST